MDVNIPRTNGASEKEIIDAELRLSCRLPRGYREFVSNHNGAKPSSNTFAVPGNESSVRRFVPIEHAASVREAIDGFPKGGVPIAEDDCGNYVWLEPATGAVYFWDHELDEPGLLIADGFEEFVALLMPFDPSSIKLQPGQVISVWIDPTFKPKFD